MVGATTRWTLAAAATLAGEALQSVPPPAPAAPALTSQVAATFYPWYDHPASHFVESDGHDALRDHFVAPERVHADSVEWYAGELAEAANAGLDLLLFASVAPDDAAKPWSAALAAALETTRERLARRIGAALLLEPWLLTPARPKEAGGGKLDLADAAQLHQLLEAVPDFFRAIRPEDWGRVDGGPLVVVGALGGVTHVPDDLFEQIVKRATEELGVGPHLVVDRTWQREGWPTWREGSPVLGVQLGVVASLAPGFDERQLAKPRAILRPREGGRVYEAAWQELLDAPPRLVVIESWNQMHDGSAIAPTLEQGRHYVALTRRYADLLRRGEKAGARVTPRFDTPVGMAEYSEDRRFSTLDEVAFRPGDEEGGILLTTECDAELAFDAAKASGALVATPRGGNADGVLRFAVTRVFPFAQPERYAATVRFAARSGPLKVDFSGRAAAGEQLFASESANAGEAKVWQFELKDADLRSARDPAPRASFELRFHGGPIEVEEIAIRRIDHRLDGDGHDEHGADPPGAIGAGSSAPPPFHRVVLHWRDLEATAGAVDDAAIGAALRAACDCAQRDGAAAAAAARCRGVVVVADAPAWAVPVGAHSEAVAQFVRHVLAALADLPALRLVELFPDANRRGDFGRASDPQGFVRVLRAVAAATHEVAPHLALTLGAIRGPDVTWLKTIHALKQPFVYDAGSFELDDESGIPGDATCQREFERMLAEWRAGGDGAKPFVLSRRSFTTGTGPLDEGARAQLLAALVRLAWQRIERAPGPIDVLDPEALPLIRGMPAARLVAQFAAARLEAVARTEPLLLERLAGGEVRTLVLGQGELVPEALAARLAKYVDGGGLLVCFGGAPFRRTATRGDDGGFTLNDGNAPAMELRDALRIDVTSDETAQRVVAVPASAPELAPFDRLELAAAATFVRRAGRPRDPSGMHRYEPLLATRSEAPPVGDLAALLTYSGVRTGALLLVGLDGGGRRLDAAAARAAEESLRALAKRVGALALFPIPDGEAR